MKIENVKIITMENGAVIENGTVEFTDGKITSVEPSKGEPSGKWLLPGFIDGHTHLGMSEDSLGFEGDDTNEMTDPVTPQLRAIDAINPLEKCFEEAREGGVTCVASAPGSANPIGGQIAVLKTSGKRIDDMILMAPAAMKFALGENPKTTYHGRNQMPETRMATAAIIRESLIKAQKYSEEMAKAAESREKIRLGQADPDDEIDDPDFDIKCDALIPVIRREIPAHFHAHRADDIFTAIRISKEFNLRCVIVHCTDGHIIAKELSEENIEAFAGPNLCDRSKPELREQSFINPGVMAQAKIKLGITTDHPVIPLQYLPLCAALAVKSGMDRDAALRAITIDPAEILGVSGRVGSIKVGKDADFVLYDGDPFVFSSKIENVWIDGVQVKG
ncbi:MAG: amidohydrolase [Firmicutes bacterium]|nr:amidohydrolase [Bacillota bacterium]